MTPIISTTNLVKHYPGVVAVDGINLLNTVTWPMMLLSGAWFSLEGSHSWVQQLAQIFPLTHMIDATRAIMSEGATLSQVMPQVWVLAAMSAVFLALGAYIFKWE